MIARAARTGRPMSSRGEEKLHALMAAVHGGDAGTANFHQTQRTHDGDELVDLGALAGNLEDEVLGGRVDGHVHGSSSPGDAAARGNAARPGEAVLPRGGEQDAADLVAAGRRWPREEMTSLQIDLFSRPR